MTYKFTTNEYNRCQIGDDNIISWAANRKNCLKTSRHCFLIVCYFVSCAYDFVCSSPGSVVAMSGLDAIRKICMWCMQY